MTRLRTLAGFALAICSLSPGLGADDKAVFIELPSQVLADGVGANGAMVVGGLRNGGGFYWMPTSGTIQISGVSATAVSRDGRTIVGSAKDSRNIEQAGIWQRAAEWRLLGSIAPDAKPCDTLLSTAISTSADGKVVVGLAWNGCSIARAFRWEESTGVVDLGTSVQGQSTRADGVSGDGKVVVGWQEDRDGFWRGARWNDGKQALFIGPNGRVGQAYAANADGSIIVGQVCNPESPLEQSAWMWTARDGVQCMPPPRVRLPAIYLGKMTATSDDGRVIGGGQSFGLESEAVLWLDKSPVYLKDYLRTHGVPNAFDGWVNTGTVTGVTRDGRIVVGYGAGPRDFQGYIAILAPLGDQP